MDTNSIIIVYQDLHDYIRKHYKPDMTWTTEDILKLIEHVALIRGIDWMSVDKTEQTIISSQTDAESE